MALTRPGRRTLIAVWTLPSAILLAITWGVYARYRIDVPERLGPEARAEVMATLRAGVEGRDPPVPSHPQLKRALADNGPVVAGVWLDGKLIGQVTASGDTAAEAFHDAAKQLAGHPRIKGMLPAQRSQARIKADIVVARGPLLRNGDTLADVTEDVLGADLLTALSLNPGVEGVGVTVEGVGDVVLVPDVLVRANILMSHQPLAFVPDFKIGLELDVADRGLRLQAHLSTVEYLAKQRSYWRFRTDSFVEKPVGARGEPPVPLTRGLPPRPELTAQNLRNGALAGGRYLKEHLDDRGRYIYQVNLAVHKTREQLDKDAERRRAGHDGYSLPRHAGTTYYLAELFRITKAEFLKEPIERAFVHLEELIVKGKCSGTLPNGKEYACVIDYNEQLERTLKRRRRQMRDATDPDKKARLAKDYKMLQSRKQAGLGSTALTVVALAEYKRATGSDRFDTMARKLTEWILYMQRDDGSFRHLYIVPFQTPIEDAQLLYYSGEAALALARMHVVTGEERYRVAAEKALDWLVSWYDFFLGGFIYGEEHWTCIAAEAAWPSIKKRAYWDFCRGYAEFLRQQQIGPDSFPDGRDLAGSYSVSPFVMPNNTPSGSRTEAMISAYLLGTYHGEPDSRILGQIDAAMSYALGQQIREDSMWDVAASAKGLGAISGSPIDRNVRIDYVQHVCSAMIRTSVLMEDPPR